MLSVLRNYNPVPSLSFGLIECGIRVLDATLKGLSLAVFAHADADRQCQLLLPNREHLIGDLRPHFFSRYPAAVEIGIRQEDQKFLASPS